MSFEKNLSKIVKDNGLQAGIQTMQEAFNTKKFSPERVSLRRLAESFMGEQWADSLSSYNRGKRVTESTEFTDSSNFSQITGQLLIEIVRSKYELQNVITEKLATTIPVTNGNLGELKIPYLSDVTLDPQGNNIVEQGMPYPQTTFKGQFYTLPSIKKVGKICSVSMETIFSDLTQQVYDSAASVGKYVSLIKFYDLLKLFLGLENNYKFNGVSYNTYNTTGAWVNKVTGYNLTDFSSINSLLTLCYNMRDPVSGQPINVEPKMLFVMPKLQMQARVILGASGISKGAFAPASDAIRLDAPNPLDSYELITSQYAYKTLIDSGLTDAQANGYVLFGDPKQAFNIRQALPLTVTQAPPLNPLEFNQDIALAVKAQEMYSVGVRDPRYMILATS